VKIIQFMASKRYVGAERSFVELSNELSKRHEVFAIVLKDCEFIERFDKKVKIIKLKSRSFRHNPLLHFEIFRLIRKIEPDIVHTHSVKATEIVYRVWKFAKFPFVATKRNSEKHSLKVRVFDKVPFCVGVSKEVTKTICNPHKATIYNGITVRKLNCEKERVFTILAIGILQERKGFEDLIKSVKELGFDFVLWIIGEGEEKRKLKSLIKELSLEKKVKLLGYKEDVAQYQCRAHLQIINSKREGLSRVLIEGLFYSDVVISTKVAGSTEILNKEFLFEFGEADQKIKEVYENYASFKEKFFLLKKGLQKVFFLERVAKEYESIYKRAIEIAGKLAHY